MKLERNAHFFIKKGDFMRNFKRFSSLLFTSAMMLGSILPTASIPVLANEDVPPVVKVNVVGEGNVLVTDVDAGKSQFALESSPLEDSFKEGTKLELKCDGQKQIVSDVSIDGVTQEYEYGNQKLELDYTTPSESSEIIVTFSDKQAEAKEAELPVADKKNEEIEKLTTIETENHPEKEADEKESNEKIRLVVEGNPQDQESITSQYGNLYVLEYASQQDANQAKKQLENAGAKVDSECFFSMDEGETTADVVETEKVDEAITKANETSVKDYSGQNVIALIDTGSDGSALDAISFVDGDASDNNGHASRMLKAIRSQDKDAKVISLKALDDKGNGTTASVVSALQYAIDSKVSIINLSLSSPENEDTTLITSKIDEAIAQGIKVVVSAGNNGSDVSKYVPANIEKAITVGAVDEKGVILPTSNYGKSVDWFVNANATSSAAATITGILSKNGEIKEDKKTVFSPKSVINSDNKVDEDEGTNGSISADDSGGAGGGSGEGGGVKDGGVKWVIHDHNDDGLGLAGTEGSPNMDAVKSAIRRMGLTITEEQYPGTNYGTNEKIRTALSDAIAQCRANYRNMYGSDAGFTPRIVAVGVAYAKGSSSWFYNGTAMNNYNSEWESAWNSASDNRNMPLYHNNMEYKVDTRFHNTNTSLTDFALTQLASANNIRIIVLNEKQPMPAQGNLHLRKKSANTAITNGNNCYSLEGAEYGLYSDAQCTKLVHKFSTDAKGQADKDGFNAGTYYLKELKAPKGYALDTKVHTIVIKAGETTTYGSNGELVDKPQSDPVAILLGKVDKQTNQNKPSGSASLEGAEFTVKFFAGENPNINGSPTRTWVLRTNKNGYTSLTNEYKVSGDDFYYNGNSDPTLPLGTLTIQETKAPQGYYINNEVFERKITSSGISESVTTYNQPTVPEQVNEFILTKVQIGTKTPIKGTVFTHTFPNGKTEEVRSNDSGQIKFTGIATGQHKLKEKSVMPGYEVNPNEFVFTVDQNGIKSATNLNGKNMTFNAGNTSGTAATLEVVDTVSPYDAKLIKINEHDKKLSGAEFTLYSDKACTKVVDKLTTNESGILQFKDLKDRTTYYFKETKAPQGYRIPVDKDGNVHVYELRAEAIPAKKQFDFYVDGKKYTTANTSGSVHLEGQDGERVVSITVVNYTTGQLPETGSNGTIALIGVGVTAMVLWFVLGKKKKNQK